jgi:3-keto-disaccharide hydrolase
MGTSPMKQIMSCLAIVLLCVPAIAADEKSEWRVLWNSKDLTGWDAWLAVPHRSTEGLELKKDAKGDYTEPVGLNKDPTKVYTVVQADGAPAIRITGEIFGALTSQEEFENYHLKLEIKWGEKKWPPREKAIRDSGLLYHCVGPMGGPGGKGPWMQSFETQIQEGDFGDFHSVHGVIVDVEAERMGAKGPLVFKKGAPKVTGVAERIIKNPLSEKPHGQWNLVEVYAVGQSAVHVNNGVPNMVLTGLRRKVGGKEEPLTKGKLQLQSEGAEVFYRNIQIRKIDKIPEELLK